MQRLFSVRNWRGAWLGIFFAATLSLALAETPTPSPKPKTSEQAKKKKKKSSPSPSPKPSKTPAAKKKKKGKATPAPGKNKAKSSPAAKPTPEKEEVKKAPPEKSGEQPLSPPKTSPTARPAETPVAAQESFVPQVNVEKDGYLGEQGLAPTPAPEKRRGWWFWSRPVANYRYLSRSVRDEIDRAPVQRRRWQFIVVHNSGTKQGSARIFDYYHKHVRRMQNGLAYHFVIGNGTSTGDGQIEIGDRWRRQINGGHVHSDYLNNIALGICLVGDFNRSQPTPRQLEACEELIRYLRQRCGKAERGEIVVRPHREVNPPQWATDCPGDDFPYAWFRRF